MTGRELIVIGFSAVVVGRIACDWKRISLLKRFASGNGLLESEANLWWNNKALLAIEAKLPAGRIRTQARMLRIATWVFWIGYVIVLFGIFLHQYTR